MNCLQKMKRARKTTWLNTLLAGAAILIPAAIARAQSAYSNAVISLSPIGYWPMHENEPMTHGDIETNYGSAGPAANGYYGDWSSPGTIQHGYTPGAIAGDSNACVYFNQFFSGTGNKGSTTNCLIIPHTSPAATLIPPFSVELWYWDTNNLGVGRGSDIFATVNAGGSENGLNDGFSYSGIRLYLNNDFNFYTYNNNGGDVSPNSSAAIVYNGGWNHIVVTDDGANIDLYLNGALIISNWPNANYAPNGWDPIEIDTGKGYTRDAGGLMQEFAIYTNALAYADITNHYYTALNPSPAVPYETLVFNDKPTIFYRFDSPSYTPPSFASLPVLANYGSSALNGVYTAGTLPAGVAGPNNGTAFAPGFGPWTNAMPGSGMSSFADAGFSPLYNPTGANASFSVAAWFQGDPCDSRVQTIVGHGIGSWGITMNIDGQIVFDAGTNNASEGSGSLPSDLVSSNEYNDGFWHFVVATHSATANILYLDGMVVATNSSPASIPGAITNVMIGADASFTNTSGVLLALGRQFEGNICEVAMFGSALTAAQVAGLYNAAEMPPVVNEQPANIVFTVANNQLVLSWPADHTGWQLQAQTNTLSVGISTNWTNVNGSPATNRVIIPINLTNGSVFYRLIYP